MSLGFRQSAKQSQSQTIRKHLKSIREENVLYQKFPHNNNLNVSESVNIFVPELPFQHDVYSSETLHGIKLVK